MAKTKQQLTREEIAQREIGLTHVRPGTAWALLAIFLATIFAVPLIQAVHEIHEHAVGNRTSAWPGCFDIFASMPRAADVFGESDGTTFSRLMAANRSLQHDIDEFEATLKTDSLLAKNLLPPVQEFTVWSVGLGNEKAYVGRDGWLFYRPGIDYLTGPGFLDPRRLAERADSGTEWRSAPQSDPRKAIFQFHRQLAERGITLIVVPVSVKAQVHPDKFSDACNKQLKPLNNPSYDEFCQHLRSRGVLVFDPTAGLVRRSFSANIFVPQYLTADTHWRPEAMEASADALAEYIRKNVDLPPARPTGYRRVTESVTNLGDIARMLRLPKGQTLYPPETVEIHPVPTAGGEIWRPIRSADVLLLGDSFSNVFSLDAMGWGAGSGFAEQISFALKRPLDVIIRNDAGAYATRESLGLELARGADRLAGKRLVIWQFAQRELATGNWKMIDMTLGQRRPSKFIVPKASEEMLVTAVISDASGVPRPGSVPYKDHIRSLHLTDLRDEAGKPIPDSQAVVYVWSMRDNTWTSGARLRAGQVVKLRLRPWSDVEGELGRINRSELDDDDLAFETPCWGEMMK